MLTLVMAFPLFSEKTDALFQAGLETAREKLRGTLSVLSDTTQFPRTTNPDGTWKCVPSDDWTSGFFSGCLWKMYEDTHDPYWKRQAERWTAGLEKEKRNTSTHDLGFMMFLSFGQGYRLTKNKTYKPIILESAASLASRFNPVIGCTKSWDSFKQYKFPVIIDNMMNLELLFWAAQNGGDKKYRDIAIAHGLKTIENHVREDGSTFHVVAYDPTTGKVLDRKTAQGYADASTWARGQAWGLHGFTETYRETMDKRFLKTAERLADWFISHLPEDFVPYWDFNAPGIPNEVKDSSAGSIAASGLLELSILEPDPARKTKYFDTAVNILKSLSTSFLSKNVKTNAILLHATGSKPAQSEVNVPLIYGDYYYIEALMRYFRIVQKTTGP